METFKLNKSQLIELFSNTQRLAKILWNEKRNLVLLMVAAIVAGTALSFVSSYVNGLVFNQIIIDAESKSFGTLLLFLLLALTFVILTTRFAYNGQTFLQKILFRFNTEYFESLILAHKGKVLDVASHEDRDTNNLINKVTENSWRINNFCDRQFFMIQGVFEVVIAAGIIMSFQWTILPLLVITAIPALYIEGKYGRTTWHIHTGRSEQKRTYYEYRRHFSWVTGIRDMYMFSNTDFFLSRIRRLFSEFQEEESALDRKRFKTRLLSILFSEVVLIGTYIYFINQAISGIIQIGTLTFVYSSINRFAGGIAGLFTNIGAQYQDSLFVSDVFGFLSTEPKVPSNSVGVILPKGKHVIAFDNVSFKYSPDAEREILKNISLVINPGEKVAFVGENGAGKTTLIKLLLREYDPTMGNIYIDGWNLKEINLSSLRNNITHLFQNYSHYKMSVREAIMVADVHTEISDEKIKRAALLGGAEKSIQKWGGFEQMIGREFGGITPSGGEAQRLALSRVFYRNRPIVILDEPTASVDSHEEAKVFKKFHENQEGNTVIFITHRLSTVKNCDRIFVLEDGYLKEQGDHYSLLNLQGKYSNMFYEQAREYLN